MSEGALPNGVQEGLRSFAFGFPVCSQAGVVDLGGEVLEQERGAGTVGCDCFYSGLTFLWRSGCSSRSYPCRDR